MSNGDEILNALAHGSLAEIAAAANVSSNTCLNCFRGGRRQGNAGGGCTEKAIEQNYLKSLLALGFQAFLIMVCVGIYTVLVQNIAVAIWECMGYTVLLCLLTTSYSRFSPSTHTTIRTGCFGQIAEIEPVQRKDTSRFLSAIASGLFLCYTNGVHTMKERK